MDRKIWALASGKGGSGKTVIAASMAAHLADLGFRVVLVDVNLGGANLHTCLGIERPGATLADFIERRTEHLEDVAIETGIPRLRLICGALDPVDVVRIRYQQKKRIIRQLNTLEADVVILDLASGTSRTELELFCAADLGALVLLPEPSAIENGYRLLRMIYFNMASEIQGYNKIEKKLPRAFKKGMVSPAAFLLKLEDIDADSAGLVKKRMQNFTPGIIINQVRTDQDRELGPEISLVCKRFFSLQVPFLGAVEYDDSVWQAARHRQPLIMDYPHSRPSRSIRQVAETLLSLSGRSS